ncbi:4-hydroxyphenylacetate 3-monooxygenase oxygenase component [Streptomyces violaceorubidus]
MAREPGLRDVLTVRPEDADHPMLRAYHVPRDQAELVERRKAFKTWSEASFGFLGRSPDYMAAGIAGFVSAPDIFAGEGFDGGDNLAAYYRRMTEGSLYQAFTITNPQIDRTRARASRRRTTCTYGSSRSATTASWCAAPR